MTRRTMGGIVCITLFAVAGLGCASGPVTGRVSLSGQAATPLSMTWRSGLFGENGSMSAAMPDGEQFSGTYQVVRAGMSRSSMHPAWTGDEPGENQGHIDDNFWGAGRDQATFVRAHLNKAIATLKEDRGGTMLCRFDLNAGEAGMGGGGSGACQTSKGAKISAQF
jgi:hypothetical protein